MNNRFPFKLEPTDAKRIIDVACNEWKKILAREWGANIILQEQILIAENRYKELRSACTMEQHRLFDNIFGKDIDFSILNDTDVFYIEVTIGGDRIKYLFKGKDPFRHAVRGYNCRTIKTFYSLICNKDEVLALGKANKDEIDLYNRIYNSCPYKDGELIFIRKSWEWILRYSTGKMSDDGYVECYTMQKKSAISVMHWEDHRPAPGVKLPE